MTATATDVGAIRKRVRATQHARSFPLLVIGALLVNYGANNFFPKPIAWQYGAPLAFFLIWALSKLNESQTGVGTGRVDYLVAAGFVFAAVNMATVAPFSNALREESLHSVWVVIVGLALLALGLVPRDAVLIAAGAVISATGALTGLLSHRYSGQRYGPENFFVQQTWANEYIAIVGAALATVGLRLISVSG